MTIDKEVSMSSEQVIGPLTRQALEAELPGKKRHKLLVVIAQHLDRGEEPTAQELLDQCPELESQNPYDAFAVFDQILACLEREGRVHITKRRYQYRLTWINHRGQTTHPHVGEDRARPNAAMIAR